MAPARESVRGNLACHRTTITSIDNGHVLLTQKLLFDYLEQVIHSVKLQRIHVQRDYSSAAGEKES